MQSQVTGVLATEKNHIRDLEKVLGKNTKKIQMQSHQLQQVLTKNENQSPQLQVRTAVSCSPTPTQPATA